MNLPTDWERRQGNKKKSIAYGAAFSLVILAILSLVWASLAFAAPGTQTPDDITVSPNQFYTGDTIEITLTGLGPNFTLPPGGVTLADVRLPMPGVFGEPGTRPATDSLGNVTFTSWVPLEVPFGSQTLKAQQLPGMEDRNVSVTVLAANVSFKPSAAAPGETVLIRGSGFSPVTKPNGGGPLGVHQITGTGTSGIKINGTLFREPNIAYPINLDSDGSLTASITLPKSYVTFPSGTLKVDVVDDAGRSGVGAWSIKGRTITLSTNESGRGGEVTVTGNGFLANGRLGNNCATVEISYAGVLLATVATDSEGSFQGTIEVPLKTTIGSTSPISATMPCWPATTATTAKHKVPTRALKATPQSATVGSQIAVSGVSFIGYTPITAITFGDVSVLTTPPPVVGGDGSFSFNVFVPKVLLGTQVIKLTAGGIQSTYTFVVLATPPTGPASLPSPTLTPTPVPPATVTPTPLPTSPPTLAPLPTATPPPAPTPTPVPASSDQLAPLADNLLTVWFFDAARSAWTYYIPGIDSLSTLSTLVEDKIYWFKVRDSQTATLNGRDRLLTAGWNLIHW